VTWRSTRISSRQGTSRLVDEMDNAIETVTVTPAQQRYASWARDVLIYTAVLNLFVEYADAIIIESFTISLLTATVLKVMLDLLTEVEHRVSGFFGQFNKLLGYFSMWVVLFLSKFVILEVIDLIFGDNVELGKFLDVVVLIITMMVVRELNQPVNRTDLRHRRRRGARSRCRLRGPVRRRGPPPRSVHAGRRSVRCRRSSRSRCRQRHRGTNHAPNDSHQGSNRHRVAPRLDSFSCCESSIGCDRWPQPIGRTSCGDRYETSSMHLSSRWNLTPSSPS